MTLFFSEYRKCAICGSDEKVTILNSTSSYGPSDLDFRGNGSIRETMGLWLQECSHCGYVSGDLSKDVVFPRDLLVSQEYLECGRIGFQSSLARRFYRHFLICNSTDNVHSAFYSILHAAWCCDDISDGNSAIICRKLSIRVADVIIQKRLKNWRLISVMKVDIMRRAGQFDEVIREYRGKWFWDARFRRIVRFGLQKAKEHDSRVYRECDVFPKIKRGTSIMFF